MTGKMSLWKYVDGLSDDAAECVTGFSFDDRASLDAALRTLRLIVKNAVGRYSIGVRPGCGTYYLDGVRYMSVMAE